MSEKPQQLGKYEIIEELGRGAFATVYRALDTTLNREVALKVLHPQLLTDPTFVARFKREARALAGLDHAHIVTVYEIGEVEGRLFIAMTLAHGSTLREFIAERGRIPWDEALALVKPMCEALDYAHGQGVIHRDLKPANVLLDEKHGLLLTDFGFARLMGDSSVSLSLSGGILGTPAYIAPEVWELDAAEPPTDVYALGCIFYELLAGEVLFAGKTPMQAVRAHDRGAQFPEIWPEQVPEGIAAVLGKALARDPSARYPNASALWHALNDLETEAQVAREEAERAVVAAQWQAETETAMAVGELSAAKMTVGRWLAIAPDDSTAQAARVEIERQLGKSCQPAHDLSSSKRTIPRWIWVVIGSICLSVVVCLTSRDIWQNWLQIALESASGNVELIVSPQAKTPALSSTPTTAPVLVPTKVLTSTDTPMLTDTLSPTKTPIPIFTHTPTSEPTNTPTPTPEPTDTPMPTRTSPSVAIGGGGTIDLAQIPATFTGAVSESQDASYTIVNNSDTRTIVLTMSSNGTSGQCVVLFRSDSLLVPEDSQQQFLQAASSTVTRNATIPSGTHILKALFLSYSDSVCPSTLSYTLVLSP